MSDETAAEAPLGETGGQTEAPPAPEDRAEAATEATGAATEGTEGPTLLQAGTARLTGALRAAGVEETLRAAGVEVDALQSAGQTVLEDEATAAALERGAQGVQTFLARNEGFLRAQAQTATDLAASSGLAEAVKGAGSELLEVGRAAAESEAKQIDVEALRQRGEHLVETLGAQEQTQQAAALAQQLPGQLPSLLQATAAKGGEVLERVDLAELAASETTQQLVGKSRELLGDMGVDVEGLDAQALLAEAAARLPGLTERAREALAAGGQNAEGLGIAAQLQQLASRSEGYEEKLAGFVGSLDVEALTAQGQLVATDAEARAAFVQRATNMCLEFFLQYLPHIRVPAISGVKDDVEYTVDNLDMSGFSLAKENVDVRLGELGAAAGEAIVTVRVTDVAATLRGLRWRYRQTYFPYLADAGNADADVSGAAFSMSFVVQRVVVDGQDEPRLALDKHGVSITGLRLVIENSRMAWAYNLLVSLFSQIVREYLVSTLNDSLHDHTGALLKKLNAGAAGYWPVILKYSGLDLAALPESPLEAEPEEGEGGDEEAAPAGADGGADAEWVEAAGSGRRELHVLVRRHGPLGIRLGTSSGATHIRVLGFPRGPNGELGLVESTGEVARGLVLVSINGGTVEDLSLPWVIRLLQRSGRPLRLAFTDIPVATGVSRAYDVEFGPGSLGLVIKRNVGMRAPIVGGFRPVDKTGRPGPAEACGKILPGDVLVGIHGQSLLDLPFEQSLELFRNAPRPISLRFASPPDIPVTFAEAPFDLSLAALDGHVVLTGFNPRMGRAQRDGVVQLGHVLHSVNGTNVHALPFKQASLTLRSASAARPLTLGFVPPEFGTTATSGGASEFLAPCEATFEEAGPLGITFGQTTDGHAYVKAFKMITGPGQASGKLCNGLVVVAIAGQNLPPGDVDLAVALMAETEYPNTVVFRDMEQFEKLAVLAA